MQAASYIALSSQLALHRQMDVIANNMANSSTPAFKAERMLFAEFLNRGAANQPLSFVQDLGTMRDTKQGPIARTGNSLDLALQGEGYLKVETRDGTLSTPQGEAGRISIVRFDNERDLVPASGGLYVTEALPTPASDTVIVQGMIEESNVEPIIEMTRMMTISHNFNFAKDLGDSESDRTRSAIDKLGKVA